jgi:ketosteroid isomerase-like protein
MALKESNLDDVAALRDMAREFTEGINGGDVDRLMRFYGPTYVDVNLRQPVQSHEERREYFRHVMRSGLQVQVHPDEIVVDGAIALVRGRIEVIRKPEAGTAPTTTELRYLEVVRKDASGWKVVWGMDGPVQEYQPSLAE